MSQGLGDAGDSRVAVLVGDHGNRRCAAVIDDSPARGHGGGDSLLGHLRRQVDLDVEPLTLVFGAAQETALRSDASDTARQATPVRPGQTSSAAADPRVVVDFQWPSSIV